MDWINHLEELRRRLILALITISIIFVILILFANPLYHILALPLLKRLPEPSHMIATQVTAPFLVPMKLAFYLSIFAAFPVFLYHFWRFVTPGLYQQERVWLWPLIIVSSLLFYAGMMFCYWVALPMIFKFLIKMVPQGIAIMTDMSDYLSFTLKLMFAFGIAFEIPVLVVAVNKIGIVSLEQLTAARPYVIVGCFILGMLLTPPDVISQILLAVPMWLLFEVGFIWARWMGQSIKEKNSEEI